MELSTELERGVMAAESASVCAPSVQSGIYQIRNLKNGKRYIGSSKNIRKRWWRHQEDLAAETHHSPALQRAWNKYGPPAFSFEVVVYCEPKDLEQYEHRHLVEMRPEYNVCMDTKSTRGIRLSKKARQNMSRAQKKSALTQERRDHLSKASQIRWAKPGAKEYQSRLAKLYAESPQGKANKKKASRISWSTPGRREHQSISARENMKRIWALRKNGN